MTSRNENAITIAWPELATSPLGDRDLLVDGEIIALNERGLPDFRTLQDRMHVRNATTAARLADAAAGDLHGLRPAAARRRGPHRRAAGRAPRRSCSRPGARRARLAGARPRTTTARCSTTRPSSRASRASSASGGPRATVRASAAAHWLKFAHRHRLSYVVGGWRPQEGTTDRLAALLVGEPTPDGLLYRGRVGSGIGAEAEPGADRAGRRRSAVRQPVRRRGAAAVDAPRHALAGAGARRRRRHPRAWATTGCGSRRTKASAPT